MPLVTAGSGVAIALPANFGIAPSETSSTLPPAAGARAIIAGSCSQATQRQVQAFVRAGGAAYAIDGDRAAAAGDVAAAALAWAADRLATGPVLVHSTVTAEAVKATQARLGAERAGALIEATLATIARGLVERGVRQLIVAGGETSGACVQALGIALMRIGPQIDPGVPWCHAATDGAQRVPLHVALKSGNFGSDDFFAKAFAMLR